MATSTERRLIVLAAARPGSAPGELATASARLARDLAGVPGIRVLAARVLPMAADNPLRGSGFTRDHEGDLVIDVDLQFDAQAAPGAAGLGTVLATGLGDALDRDRSIAVLGEAHTLRPLDPDAYFGLYVAVIGHADVLAAPALAGWFQVGRYNAVHHPSCSGYAQIHADPEATADVARALGLTGAAHLGVAFEAFRSAEALADGQAYAAQPVAGYDEREDGASTLLALLDRYLDFASATSVMTQMRYPG